MRNNSLLIVLGLALAACQPTGAPKSGVEVEHSEAISIQASAATTPTRSDSANDPAIWINAEDPAASLIFATDVLSGIEVYSLDGERVNAMSDRPISLVDIRNDFPMGDQSISLVAAFDAGTAELVFYAVDVETRSLRDVSATPVAMRAEIGGLCLYRSSLSGKYYAFAVGDGVVQQWELDGTSGAVEARHTRTVPVGHGAGYCAVHDREAALYFSQEGVGVFMLNPEPESEAEKHMVDAIQPFGRFVGDIKGVAVRESNGSGQLIVSDADASRLQLYDLATEQHIGTLVVEGVEETEGIAVTSMTLSATSQGGLLVLTDDDNEGDHTNYKLVQWQALADAMGIQNAAGSAHSAQEFVTVKPILETEPVETFGDAADDLAIWIHPEDPKLSVIIGAQKKHGINVYDLEGNVLQSRPDGRINNVDLRYGFALGNDSVALVAGSNRTTDSIGLWDVDKETRTLTDVADGLIDTGMVDPYGLCMYRSSESGEYYVFVNDTDGLVRQWRLADNGRGRVAAEQVREFQVESQTEGCVADDETGQLYVGEEDVGIWRYSAEPDGGTKRVLVDGTGDNGNLTADVEGLAIYYGDNGSGYLVASNQGADNYVLYEREGDNRFVGIFHVVANEASGIDGISETDGLDVNSAYLGPDYPAGIFVAQDGRNITPNENQNFKLVSWQAISDAMGLEQAAAE